MPSINSNSRFSPFVNSIFLIVALFCIIYTILNRSFLDFIKYSIIITLGMLVLGTILFMLKIRSISALRSINKNGALTIIIVLLFILGPIYYSFGVFFNDLPRFRNILDLSSNIIIPIIVFVLLISGLLLFYIRLFYRCTFGISESLLGIVIAINKFYPVAIDELTNSSYYLAILTASLFLVVRGFDNIYTGLTKEPFDPIFLKFANILKKAESIPD